MKKENQYTKKRRYQHKAFFWSLGHKTTVQVKSESSELNNGDFYLIKSKIKS